jgi:hypothetical protein
MSYFLIFRNLTILCTSSKWNHAVSVFRVWFPLLNMSSNFLYHVSQYHMLEKARFYCMYITHCFSIYQSMNIGLLPPLLAIIMLLWTWVYKQLLESLLLIPLSIHLEVELLDQTAILFNFYVEFPYYFPWW